MARLPLPLVIVASLFAVAIVWLLAASLAPRSIPTFSPEPATRGAPDPAGDTVTIDARDPVRWRFFSFARGALAPEDSAGWDLAVRRFRVIPAGEVARIDTLPFDEVRSVPADGFQPTVFSHDTANPAMGRWYRYNWFSHLLSPKPEVYVIRSRTGQAVKLAFLGYYCPGPEPGCVTLRFATLP
jgi:hypothetical protein